MALGTLRTGHGIHPSAAFQRAILSFLKKRILHKLMLNGINQLKARQLEQLDCLLQLRRHQKLLAEFKLLFKLKSHRETSLQTGIMQKICYK